MRKQELCNAPMQNAMACLTPSNLRLPAACSAFTTVRLHWQRTTPSPVWKDDQSVVCGDVFRISKIFEARGWARGGVLFPLLMDGFLVQPRIPSINPPRGPLRKRAATRLCLRGDRDRFRTLTGAIERERPAPEWSPPMNTDLTLAQNHAFQLSRTLMVPVTLFRSGDEFGVLPSDELDDGEVETIAEFDPFAYGPAH